jgi:thiamine pyrophosphate-dependent acetolactate synthase large subunit-like protein
MTSRNGGAAVVETLAAHGVDTVFGIPALTALVADALSADRPTLIHLEHRE